MEQESLSCLFMFLSILTIILISLSSQRYTGKDLMEYIYLILGIIHLAIAVLGDNTPEQLALLGIGWLLVAIFYKLGKK